MAEQTSKRARALAHRAVTEGVNLAFMEQMRRALYELADAYDNLDQRLQAVDAPQPFRYRLIVNADDYALMESLSDLASAALGKDAVDWLARTDEEMARA